MLRIQRKTRCFTKTIHCVVPLLSRHKVDEVCIDNGFTWQSDISQHCLLTVFDAADLGEVDIQSQEGHAAEEGHGSHEDAIITGVLVAVEDAVLLHFVWAVDVALVGDAAEDHDGEELQRRREERIRLRKKKQGRQAELVVLSGHLDKRTSTNRIVRFNWVNVGLVFGVCLPWPYCPS